MKNVKKPVVSYVPTVLRGRLLKQLPAHMFLSFLFFWFFLSHSWQSRLFAISSLWQCISCLLWSEHNMVSELKLTGELSSYQRSMIWTNLGNRIRNAVWCESWTRRCTHTSWTMVWPIFWVDRDINLRGKKKGGGILQFLSIKGFNNLAVITQ